MSEQRPAPEQPFTSRMPWVLGGIGVISFALAVAYAMFGDKLGLAPSSQNDAYSRSAIGHHAFARLLRAVDVPVVVSRHDSGARAGDEGILVIAEPKLGGEDALVELDHMQNQAGRVLVVLPKWVGVEDEERRRRISHAVLWPTSDAEEVLGAVGIAGEVVRADARGLAPSDNELEAEPSLGPVAQFVVSDELEPVIGYGGRILLGRAISGYGETWVLADPDLIANHGLDDGDNAAVAVLMIDAISGGGGDTRTVVIDETLHGHVTPPSLWHELVSFPLVLASLSALLALAVVLWAAMGRFGRPEPPPPAIAPGKGFLIENTAELMRSAGHLGHALERYLAATLADVARKSHMPSYISAGEQAGFLDRLARARKVETTVRDLEQEVFRASRPDPRQAARALAAATRIHKWRQEMIDGPSDHSRRR